MNKGLHFVAYVLLLLSVTLAVAEPQEPKMVKGMSIIGNDESPKSLYIVPWNSTDDRSGVKLSSDIMKEDLVPIDKNEFIREIEFYYSGNSTSTAVSN